jgi:site-specific DNA-methyltransferase (adenine-specific)
MVGMAEYPDNHFDLAIVDPPFPMNSIGGGDLTGRLIKKDWYLKVPNAEYFRILKQISKNQIIWGGNYFTEFLPPNNNWVIWYKNNGGVNYSMAELAWCSIQRNIMIFEYRTQLTRQLLDCYDHPCPKPIALYRWLLENYAKPGDLILDTHVGSASSLIACEALGFDYVGYEIDKDYYEAAQKRLEDWRSLPLFDEKETNFKAEQLTFAV